MCVSWISYYISIGIIEWVGCEVGSEVGLNCLHNYNAQVGICHALTNNNSN